MTVECEPVAVMDDGWSEWLHPKPGFLMQCCECGLIHEMQVAIVPPDEDNTPFNQGENKRRIVLFRMRRPE